MRGSEMVERAGSAVNSAIAIGTGVALMPGKASPTSSTVATPKPSPVASGKPLTSFGSVGANREMEKNKTLWEKITKVIRKAYEKGASKAMLSKIYSKFGIAIAAKISAAIAGIVAAPFSVGVSLLITAIGVGMLAKDVYDLYEWFVEYEKELDAYEKSSSPSPALVTETPSSPPAAVQGRSTMENDPRRTDGAPKTSPTSPAPITGTAIAGDIDPSKTTFNDLTREQQDIFMQKQREAEGFKPGSLTYDLNNPGAMLYSPWQKKYGAELDTTGRGVGTVKGLFAKFPTLQDGVEAQRALLSGQKYGNLPLEQAINQWVTGNKLSDVDTNMGGQTNAGYKNKIYAALGAPPATSSVPPVTVASAPSSPATVAAAPSRPAIQIASASTSLADTMRSQMQTPVVINTATTNNNVRNGGNGGQGSITTPSIVDSELMKLLVERVAA